MRTEFIREYDIDNLAPADYNPRYLPSDKFEKLKESIGVLGIIKPLIINGDNGILTAGHQRARAIKACGITTAPVIRINGIKIQDEIRFNLFHNSIETEMSTVRVNLKNDITNEYTVISHEDIEVIKRENAPVVKAIGQLILKYGEWGSVVCDKAGNVILNNEYAVAAKATKTDLIAFVVSDEKKKAVKKYLCEDYGEYNYDTLGIKSYNQLYCQMNRLHEGAKKANKSSLYENYVLPYITKDIRILDFGAGKCAYAKMLQSQGYKVFAYEPNFQNSKNNIDIKAVVKMIKDIEHDVEKNGLYDVVVLDSVLNSVVSQEVENYVVAVCRCFLKDTGIFMCATRNLEQIIAKQKFSMVRGSRRELEFLDKNNFSATFRSGVWTMQHFHDQQTLEDLMKKYYSVVETHGTRTGSNIYAICKDPLQIDAQYADKALEFELNMEYPRGYKHNKHKVLKRLILDLIK